MDSDPWKPVVLDADMAEWGEHNFTVFDQSFATDTPFAQPEFFNDSFAQSPAPPATPIFGSDIKPAHLQNESLSHPQPALQPRSIDGGSSASPDSSIQDSSSESSRSRKRKTSPVVVESMESLDNDSWLVDHDMKMEYGNSTYNAQLMHTERELDSIGTQMATNFPSFSSPNSPGPFGSGPPEETITPSKLEHSRGLQHIPRAPANIGKPSFFIGDSSRDGSPSSGPMIPSQGNSPTAFLNNQSPSPIPKDGVNIHSGWNPTPSDPVWTDNHTSGLLGMTPSPYNNPATASFTAVDDGHTQVMPTFWVMSDSNKSRVETQINMRITIFPLPQGVTTLHLPTHTISKPKLLATEKDKEKYGNRPETLELHTMLVCASAMQKPGLLEQSYRRAAGLEQMPPRRPSNDSNAGSEDGNDPSHPLNGGEVRICENCMNRERKRAGRKRVKKVEDEKTWLEYEQDRVIVFNDKEYKDWEEPKPPKDGLPHPPSFFPPGSKQIDVPMRIACYCRHQGEKTGFQVIFTLKNSENVVVAQNITCAILITDDHKTQNIPGSAANTASNEVAHVQMGQEMYETDQGMIRTAYPRPYHSTTDLQSLQQRHYPSHFINQQTIGQAGMPSHPTSASMTPRNMSRQASPSAQIGPNKKRKPSSSAHRKIPSTLNMTRADSAITGFLPSGPNSAGLTGIPASFPQTGTYILSPDTSMVPTSLAMPIPMASAAQTTSGLITPGPRTTSYENLANGAYFSAPNSAHPSRTGSPVSASRSGINAYQHQQFQNSLTSQMINPLNNISDPPPVINKVVPGEGPQCGGIEVTCLGRGFFQGVEVMFGDNVATTTTFWGPSTLVCLVPPSAVPGPVRVTLRHKVELGYSPQPILASDYKFTYIADDERQLLEMAITALGLKSNGTRQGQFDVLRQMAAGGMSWDGSPTSGSYTGQRQHRQATGSEAMMDTEELLLAVLNIIDMDESPHPPKFNLKRSNGATMLSMACSLGYTRFAAGLLARGANPDVRDNGGFTPLMMAAMHGHAQIVRRLILRGADPMTRSLRGYLAEELASSPEVVESLRKIPHHTRTRSAGAVSLRSRASSAASVRSLWEGPSHTPISDFSSGMSAGPDDSSTSEDVEGSVEAASANMWVRSRRNSAVLHSPNGRAAVLQPQQEPPISPAAIFNWGNQLAAQIHHFQQNVNWNFPTFQLPPMPNLPDYQAHPMVRRISSLVPHRIPQRNDSSSSEATIVEEQGWRNYIPFSAPSPPPSYDHLYPGRGEDSEVVKKLNSVAETLLDQKTAAVDTIVGEASSSVTRAKIEALDIRIGKKPLSKEKQEELREAHAQRLKKTRKDNNLWFFWLPLLIAVILLILHNFVPGWFSTLMTISSSVRSRVSERIVELA